MVQLKHLDLSFNGLRHLPQKLFASMRYLKILNLSNNQLSFNQLFLDCGNVQELAPLKRLEDINLSFNRIKYVKGIDVMSETLYFLDLSFNDIDWSKPSDSLEPLLQCKNLERLNLSGTGLTSHDFEDVGGDRWLNIKYLHELKLNRNYLTSLRIPTDNALDDTKGKPKLGELNTIECSYNFFSTKEQQRIASDWKLLSNKLKNVTSYSLYHHMMTPCAKMDWDTQQFTNKIIGSVLFCDSNLLHLHKNISGEMKKHEITHIIQIITDSEDRCKLLDGLDPQKYSEHLYKTYKRSGATKEYLVVHLNSNYRLNFERLDDCVEWITQSNEHCLLTEYNACQHDKELSHNLAKLIVPSVSIQTVSSDDSLSKLASSTTSHTHSSSASSIDLEDNRSFEACFTILIAYIIKSKQLRLDSALAYIKDQMIVSGNFLIEDVRDIPYQHHLLLQYDLKLREERYQNTQSSLKRTLERDDLRTQFRHYCSTEQSSQNILFWETVEFTYKAEFRNDERIKIATNIFNTFISESGTSALNISQSQIQAVSKLIFSDEQEQIPHPYIPLNIFDNMLNIIENVMMDTERRFQRVENVKKLV